jgi:mRNA-degrading endonuclease toxin of MazEF toxin-antitoxin module
VRRGEVWTVVGHGLGSKPRPGIVIQNDVAENAGTFTVIPVTTTVSEIGRVRTRVSIADEDGARVSFAMVDKITPIKVQNFGKKIGELSLFEIRAVESALLAHLGFGSRLPPKRLDRRNLS